MANHELMRVPTGIEGLDRMLDGGLFAGRLYLLIGNSGSGRSTIGGHFLMDGIQHGEDVLYVAIDSSPADINACMSCFGWDTRKIVILNAHPRVRDYKARGSVVEVSSQRTVGAMGEMGEWDKASQQPGTVSSDLSLPTLQLMLQKELEDKSYDRILIDSLTSLKMFGAEEIQWELGINSIFRLLAEEGATTLMISDVPRIPEPVRAEYFLSRGIIRTIRTVVGGKTHRGIFVEKFRGSAHDLHVRPMRITQKGVHIDADKTLPPAIMAEIAREFPRP
ncbi:MAG: ATPase domain-containing protein [Thermoplasmata archaeon]